MVATKELGKPDLVSREPQKILGAFFARQANNSEPAGVKVTKVPDSCILSQARSIASVRPATGASDLQSVQQPDRAVQNRSERHPRGVGREQERCNLILSPRYHDEANDRDQEQQDHAKGDIDAMA